jgi:uncharacterized repeat protein (TIGR01451 family)
VVEDDDGGSASDDDSATVTYTDVAPNITVAKTATPSAVGEPGADVTFSVDVENLSSESVALVSLVDDVFGDLLDPANPLLSVNSCTAQPTSIPVGGIFSCSFDAFVAGNFGDSAHVDTVTALVEDDDSNSVSDDDSATVVFEDLLPLIDLSKTPSVGSLPEPGGTVVFTVVVNNIGAEPVTLTSLMDSVFGDLLDSANGLISSNTCPTQSKTIGVGASLVCTFEADLVGDASGPDHANSASAIAVDDDGNSAPASDSATVTYTDVLPTVAVTKTPSTGAVMESSGVVTFAVEIENTSPEALTVTSVEDSVFGDLLDPTNTAVSSNTCPTRATLIPVGETFTCQFDGVLVGDASGPDHENTVTAGLEDDDGNSVTDTDVATVTFDDTLPNISVTKTPSQGSVSEPGATVTFTVSVSASASEDLILTSLVDDIFGDLLDPANPLVSTNSCTSQSTTIPASGTFTCTFEAFVGGNFGDPAHGNTVTATAEDNERNEDSADDSARVIFDNTVPSLTVDKTAGAASVDEPGATVTFTVVVTNTGGEDASLTALVDDVFGDLLDASNPAVSANTCATEPRDIAAGDTFACTFDGFVAGDASGPSHENMVTATIADSDGDEASEDDNEIVSITDVPPVISVDKTPSPASVAESGGVVTFTVVVSNTSVESVTVTDLRDDAFGNLLDPANPNVSNNTCPTQPTSIPAGNALACTFDGFLTGDASGPDHMNTVTVGVVDDDGSTAGDDDSAVVSFDDTPPSIVVAKTPTQNAVEAPGESVTFVIAVTNDGTESVTLAALVDDVFGDLLDPSNSNVSSNTCPSQPRPLAVGEPFSCTFDGFVGGADADPDHINTVFAGAIDNDGTSTNDEDSATVTIETHVEPASVSGNIWVDLDPDLVFDSTEPPYVGLTVSLFDVAGSLVATTNVQSDGSYEFNNLVPGDYTVVVEDGAADAGYVVVLDPDGTNDLTTTFSIAAGEALTNRDFAFRGDGQIGDSVWLDLDGDGVQDAAEDAFPGVSVELRWAGLDGVLGTGDDFVYRVMITDADGHYLFTELPPGVYRVEVDVPEGFVATTATSWTITLDPSEAWMDGDFGFVAADPTLPTTGAESDQAAAIGLLLLVIGALLVIGTRISWRRWLVGDVAAERLRYRE